MSTPGSTPILYSFRRCPYAIRARMALSSSAVTYVIREISLRNKPDEMLQASPKGTVPVLMLQSGEVIDESIDIMQWALSQNDPENWLARDEGERKQMIELIDSNDGPFKFHLDRMKYTNRYPGSDPIEHRAHAIEFLTSLEGRLEVSDYLFGGKPTLADVAIFPFVRQFAHVDIEAFAALPLKRVQRWLSQWETSPLFRSVMEEGKKQ